MRSLKVEGLTKLYADKKAVNNINFMVKEGEIFGLLGPNGAGKTSTIKMLTGLLEPTAGNIDIMGLDPLKEPQALRHKIGVVTEHSQMYNELTGLENLLYYGALFGYKDDEIMAKCLTLLARVDLMSAKDALLGTYSTGMRQRLSLARALLHDPELLFLDEPTSGLDPEGAEVIHALLRELSNEEGRTIVLCTHQLQYAESICTTYGFMSNGKLKAVGTMKQLQETYLPKKLVAFITSHGCFELKVDNKEAIASKIAELVAEGCSVYEVKVKKPTLEELYFKVMTQDEEGDIEC